MSSWTKRWETKIEDESVSAISYQFTERQRAILNEIRTLSWTGWCKNETGSCMGPLINPHSPDDALIFATPVPIQI